MFLFFNFVDIIFHSKLLLLKFDFPYEKGSIFVLVILKGEHDGNKIILQGLEGGLRGGRK